MRKEGRQAKKTEFMGLWVSSEAAQRARLAAKAERITISEVLRRGLDQYTGALTGVRTSR